MNTSGSYRLFSRFWITAFSVLFIHLLFSYQASAQNNDLENLLVNRQIGCADISLSSSEYIPYYIQNNLMDSALMVLSYWGGKCGNTEPVMRTNILLALELFYFDEEMIPDDFLRRMSVFSDRMEMIRNNNTFVYNYHQAALDYVPVGGDFDKWTMEFAQNLLEKYEPGTQGYFLSLLYSGATDTAYSLLSVYPYNTFKVGLAYNELVQHYLDLPSSSLSGFAGTWIPLGPLESMGIHPEFGLTYGLKQRQNLYELVMGVKFIKTPETYLTRRDKNAEWEYTDEFSGVYLGFEYSRDLIPNRRNGPFFSIGTAYDAITTLNADNDNKIDASTSGSYNFNLGGGYRLFLNNRSYLGLQARYNIVDYTLKNLFDKKGHVVTIRLTYGVFQNAYREAQLNSLKCRNH
jgi:hypothetical protein